MLHNVLLSPLSGNIWNAEVRQQMRLGLVQDNLIRGDERNTEQMSAPKSCHGIYKQEHRDKQGHLNLACRDIKKSPIQLISHSLAPISDSPAQKTPSYLHNIKIKVLLFSLTVLCLCKIKTYATLL